MQGLVAIAIAHAEPLALVDEIKAADCRQMNLTFLLELKTREDFLHKRSARLLALGVLFTECHHGEGVTGGRRQSHDILTDLPDASGGDFDLSLCVTHLPADGILVVLMSRAQRPVPIPGSSTRPPRQPRRSNPAQIARMIASGVKWAY